MMNTPVKNTFKLDKRSWVVMAALAVTGQIAWAVENTWFNSFVYDTITRDPQPIAIMVAASAIVATLTTLFIGSLSDRSRSKWGRRRPFIVVGYFFWGLMTAIFPMASWAKSVSIAVILVVSIDCLMTFFGSMANDAAFNAWTADITPPNQRGRVEGVLNLSLFVAQILSMTAAGILIDKFGYFAFFYALGGIVMLVGLLAGTQVREEMPTVPEDEQPASEPFFRWAYLNEYRQLFILFLVIMLAAIGMNVAFPYLIIYLENFIGVSKSQFAVIGGGIMLVSGLLAIPFGILADRWNKKWVLLAAIIVSAAGCWLFSLVRSVPMLAVAGILWQGFYVAVSIASVSWMKELLPAEARGKFLGIRMIFWILIPMVIGPAIGSALIRAFGIPATLSGEAGFIPVPVIFQASAAISLLALIPSFFLKPEASSAGFATDLEDS